MKPPKLEFEAFRQVVLASPHLQRELRDIPEMNDFAERAVELGRRQGFDFTVEEVREAARAAHRQWLERWI